MLELMALHDLRVVVLEPAGRGREGQRRMATVMERLAAPREQLQAYLEGGSI
eukprot:COSAG01_NODE_1501_length_10094_cov_5.987113_4_plen_52_part_00